MGALSSAFTGIIIAVISSWVTVQLSLRRFQKEKIWERKFEAYIKIIEALHNVKDYMATEENFEIGIRNRENASPEYFSNSFAKYRTANDEVAKYRSIGELIISEEAVLLLNEYFKNTNVNVTHYMDEINSIWNAASSCLTKLLIIAKEDLNESTNSYFISIFISKMYYLKQYLERDNK